MTNLQKNKLDAFNRYEVVNAEHQALIDTIIEYPVERANLLASLGIISNAAIVQAGNKGTTSDAADAAKSLMAKCIEKYSLRAKVKAKQSGNTTLAKGLTIAHSSIYDCAKNRSVQRANNIRKKLNDNLATLTNINAKIIKEIDKAIADYVALKDAPVLDVQERTATGTNPLPAAFKTATVAMNNMYDLVYSYFNDVDEAAVQEFALAKQIIKTGVHHSGVQGIVKKNGNLFAKANASIPNTKKITATDDKGYYLLSKLRQGTHTIEISTETGDFASKTVTVKRGQISDLDFDL